MRPGPGGARGTAGKPPGADTPPPPANLHQLFPPLRPPAREPTTQPAARARVRRGGAEDGWARFTVYDPEAAPCVRKERAESRGKLIQCALGAGGGRCTHFRMPAWSVGSGGAMTDPALWCRAVRRAGPKATDPKPPRLPAAAVEVRYWCAGAGARRPGGLLSAAALLGRSPVRPPGRRCNLTDVLDASALGRKTHVRCAALVCASVHPTSPARCRLTARHSVSLVNEERYIMGARTGPIYFERLAAQWVRSGSARWSFTGFSVPRARPLRPFRVVPGRCRSTRPSSRRGRGGGTRRGRRSSRRGRTRSRRRRRHRGPRGARGPAGASSRGRRRWRRHSGPRTGCRGTTSSSGTGSSRGSRGCGGGGSTGTTDLGTGAAAGCQLGGGLSSGPAGRRPGDCATERLVDKK